MQYYEEYEGDIYHVWNANFEDGYTFQCKMPGSFYDFRFDGDMLITLEVFDCPNYDGEDRVSYIVWKIPNKTEAKAEAVGGSVGSWYFHPDLGEDQCVWNDAHREIEYIRRQT